jgi:translation initiation factor 1A
MVKKKGKGTKFRSQGVDGEVIRVRLPKEDEVLGQVIQNLGGGLLLTRCTDGHTRQIRIPGKLRRRMWTRVGDVILLIPEYGLHPDTKGQLEYTYRKNEVKFLYDQELIPEEYLTI